MDKIQIYTLKSIKNRVAILEPSEIVDKETAHQKALLHKSAHLLIICENKILCRFRSLTELRYPGLYTTTIGAHVPLGNNYQNTLQLLLPVVNLSLDWVGEYLVHDQFENEVNGLYIARVDTEDLPDKFLENKKLFSKTELAAQISEQETTPHLAEAFKLIVSII